MPRFQNLNVNRQASYDWAAGNREQFLGAVRQAKANAAEQFAQERQSRGKPAKGRA